MPGIFLLAGMGLQFPAGSIVASMGEDGTPQLEVKETLVRLDLWPTWLEIGCQHAERARAVGATVVPDLADAEKFSALTAELQAGLVAITAFAFAVDGLYDTVRQELGLHPDQETWKRKRTGRDAQVAETLRYHFKLGPDCSAQLRTVISELFRFRSRAVHPDSRFVAPNYRPQLDAGVHPHLITFSGPHAVQCRALVLELLHRLLERADDLSKAGAETGWLDRGRTELDRLSALYRVAGDDELAFATGPVVP